MNRRYSIYEVTTGLFTGRQVGCSMQTIAANTPEGCAALEGEYDSLSQRVDLTTGAVVDYQPPQPDDDHEWNAERRRWVKKADVVAREARERRTRALVDAIETGSARAIREALLLVLPEGPEKARLQKIDDEIAALRGDVA
jgi:hypothetical protein